MSNEYQGKTYRIMFEVHKGYVGEVKLGSAWEKVGPFREDEEQAEMDCYDYSLRDRQGWELINNKRVVRELGVLPGI